MSEITASDLRQQIQFSHDTFGPGRRTNGVLDHIAKELEEIRKEPLDLSEWIDVIILGLDGAWRAGHTAEDIIEAYHAKMRKNMSRTWPDWRLFDENTAIEHDRSFD